VTLDELLTLPVALLEERPALVDRYRGRWQWIFVDEYQDVDPVQYQLLRLLCPPGGNLCAIGDPDQAIYSFRGADVEFFLRFSADFGTPDIDARVVRLTRNYRSSAPILATAVQAIAPTTLVPGRRLDPARLDLEAPMVGLYPAVSVADERTSSCVRSTSWSAASPTGRTTTASTPGRCSAAPSRSPTSPCSTAPTRRRHPFVDALSRAGVPVQKRSHDRLLDRPGVAAIARELRLADG